MLKKQHKAQSSIEFVILVTFLLIIFTVIAIFAQARISNAREARDKNYANQVKNIVFNEIKIAKSMPYNYTKLFKLPTYIEGDSYVINVTDGVELTINFKNKEYVYFFTQDFTQDSKLEAGVDNTISKLYNGSDIVYNLSY